MANTKQSDPARDAARLRDLREQHRLEVVGHLAGGVAHEINNPIQSIMNYAQLLRARLADAELKDFAEEILHEAQRVATIVRNLQGFARTGEVMMTELAPRELIESTLALTRSVLRKEGIATQVTVGRDLPRVQGRAHELQQLLMNLFTGSRDALNHRYPRGGPDKRLEIRGERMGTPGTGRVRIVVMDWGTPISAQDAQRAFDPFFSLPGRDQGTGVGRSISRTIAQEHGGSLVVDSGPRGATCFVLELPSVEETAA